MAIHSSILAWRIPWTEESRGLQSIGSQTLGHDSVRAQQRCISLHMYMLVFFSTSETFQFYFQSNEITLLLHVKTTNWMIYWYDFIRSTFFLIFLWMYKQDLSRKSPEPNKRISRKPFLQEVTTKVYFPETLTTRSIFFDL